MQVRNNGEGELVGRGLATQVLSTHLSLRQHRVHRIHDLVTVIVQVHVTQHFGGTEQHRGRIGHVLADGLRERVTCTLQRLGKLIT